MNREKAWMDHPGKVSTMSDPSASQTYVFDQSQIDHERLIRQARRTDVGASEACVRAGLQAGARAIDVGCGPLGVLPVLAELVGSTGSVVGLDANHAALDRAREALDRLGVRGVELVEANVNALDQVATLRRGSFDFAFCRFLLIYQQDPGATLRQIARLIRSGGRIVATDVLYDPIYSYPRFHPPVPAAERIQRLFFALVERKGGTLGVARQYRRICEQADVRLIEQRGRFVVPDDPRELLVLFRDMLLSMQGNLVAENLATDDEIDALVGEMDATPSAVEFGAGPLGVEMIAEVP
jgi:ubiquinone/menaquinone biosynthesis C-methylase UbiE